MGKVLIACEESQIVTKEMRALGIEAYSCDIEPCSGGCPEWHIQADVVPLLKQEWDMIIAFPPCTYLTVTGNKWMKPEFATRFPTRQQDRKDAIDFFMLFANNKCERIAIENPIGIMSTQYRKPNQIVHPYYFGDAERKSTCLWLKGLPNLIPTDIVEPEIITYKNGKGTDSKWHVETLKLPAKERAMMRSKTFPGIAKAMATQWGLLVK
jgi:hypothetical protein